MSGYGDIVIADRRLLILRALAAAEGYALGERLVASFLRSMGHAVSRAALTADLDWLASQELAQLQRADGLVIARLTDRGLDVAEGRERHPCVRRPEPGE